MKKALMLLVKYVNHYTNDRLTPEQEANSILQYLLLKNSTTHSIEIFEALEVAMQGEMRKRESEATKVRDAVNKKWGKEPEMIRVIDPTFLEPIKN